jgi:hypothetical protein
LWLGFGFGEGSADAVASAGVAAASTTGAKGEWALTRAPRELMQALTTKPWASSTVVRATQWLGPREPAVQEGLSFWRDFLKAKGGELSARERVGALAFGLAAALSSGDSVAGDLIAITFGPVHDAAGENGLDVRSWTLLAREAPPAQWWREWDHCERLRAAVGRVIVRNRVPARLVLEAIRAPQILDDVLGFAEREKTGRQYVRTLVEEVSRENVAASDGQLRVLRGRWQ